MRTSTSSSRLLWASCASWALLLACSSGGGGGSDPTDAGDATADVPEDTVEDSGSGDGDTVEIDVPDVVADGSDSSDAGDATDTADVPLDLGPACVPEPTAQSQLPAGATDNGAVLAPGGRGLSTPGTLVELAGFPSNLVFSEDARFAYVLTSSNDDRRVMVVDVGAATVVQNVQLSEAFLGIAINHETDRLYVSGGAGQLLHEYSVSTADGLLTFTQAEELPSYTSAMALNADGTRLFLGSFTLAVVYEIDLSLLGAEGAIAATWTTAWPVWDLAYLAGRDELVVSAIEGENIQFIRRGDAVVEEPLIVGRSTTGLAASSDEARVFVTSSGTDELVEVDVATRTVEARVRVGESDLLDADGLQLGRSNANNVALAPDGGRIYVTRGADNAISVFEVGSLDTVGAIPTAWYPTGAFITPDGATMVVTEGKGLGTGPNNGVSSKDLIDGTVSIVDLGSLDLAEATAQVEANFNRPNDVFPFECDGFFPIPTVPGAYTPIEHVILVVKENKTFDCVFGDLVDMDVDADPSLVRWGADITPNQHALARTFNISDNFYDEVEDSDMGHITLTSGHMSEYAERVWLEAQRTGQFLGFQLDAPNIGPDGNLFTHLMDNDVDIRIYGEIVGMTAEAANGEQPIRYSDTRYPGGPFYTLGARDTDRAEYVVEQIQAGRLASFTFMLMPNDHTGGVTPGNPTPEAQVADNDYGLGLLIEGLSNSPYWASTAVIVVEDDPQGCEDHVDSHRSFVLVISPWARRNYVSHVNASYQSVFATITRILGVPPMGRPDAGAAPLWDMFTGTPDYAPFAAVPRIIPEDEKILDINTPGARESMRMDFRGPDRNEDLGSVLDAYRLWRMGRISAEEAQDRIDRGVRSRPALGNRADEEFEEAAEEREEEAVEELYAFDVAWREYAEYLAEQGEVPPPLVGAPVDELTIDAVMTGRLPLDQFRRFAPAR